MLFVNSGMAATVGSGLGGRTYEDFQAHIATLTSKIVAWGSALDGTGETGNRTTAGPLVGHMYDTSWAGFPQAGSTIARVVQHALPSEPAVMAQIAAGWEIYFETGHRGNWPSFRSIDRNGYVSLSYGGPLFSISVTKMIVWDGEKAWVSNPEQGIGPAIYTWNS
jgi:hypothetical protein